MANSSLAEKLVDLLERKEKFVVIPLAEYEDLVDSSDPSFWQALGEAESDLKVGRVRGYKMIFRELKAHAKSTKHGKSRARHQKA